jgi:hypothetical protein
MTTPNKASPAATKVKAVKAAPVEQAQPTPPVDDGVETVVASKLEKPAKTDMKKGDKKGKKPKKEKKEKKEKKNKEAVLIRFDDDQLPQIDARAEAIGLSRAAWVRMVVAQALAKA